MGTLPRIISLAKRSIKSPNPAAYLFTRVFANNPKLFKRFYFTRNGYKLRFTNSSLTAAMFENGSNHLNYDELFIGKLLTSGDLFLDIGANIGHISISVKTQHPTVAVLAVEANPITHETLLKNITLNELDIKTSNSAVGSYNGGTLEIQDSISDDCNSVISQDMINAAKDHTQLYLVKHNRSFRIPHRSIDSLVEEFNLVQRVRLIKIDVEGYELLALKGASKTLQKTDLIYFEFWENLSRKYRYGQRELIDFLHSEGFSIYRTPREPSPDMQMLRQTQRVYADTALNGNTNLIAINKKYLDVG